MVSSREALLGARASTERTILESSFGFMWPVLVLGWLEQDGLTEEMLAAVKVDVSQKMAVWSSLYASLG